jgi:uncharacterized protein (TIGR03435 family)
VTIRLLLPLAIAGLALAQNQTPKDFEVVSIKPHHGIGDSSDRKLLPGGRFVGRSVSVRTLIRMALAVEDNRMSGAPGWIDTETYDIDAKTGTDGSVTNEEFQRLVLTLLQERFQFRFHRDSNEAVVYWLVTAKGGPKLKAHAGDAEPSMSTNTKGAKTVMKATQVSMASLAGALRRQVGRPVEDHTGLNGEFDISLEWDREEAADSTAPSIFTALQEQLGLRLNSAKGKVETVVIDRVERPSAN